MRLRMNNKHVNKSSVLCFCRWDWDGSVWPGPPPLQQEFTVECRPTQALPLQLALIGFWSLLSCFRLTRINNERVLPVGWFLTWSISKHKNNLSSPRKRSDWSCAGVSLPSVSLLSARLQHDAVTKFIYSEWRLSPSSCQISACTLN